MVLGMMTVLVRHFDANFYCHEILQRWFFRKIREEEQGQQEDGTMWKQERLEKGKEGQR